MVLEAFIQNYFEIHGSFDKIMLSPVAENLRQLSKSLQCSTVDICYKYLGTPTVVGEIYSDVFNYAVQLASGSTTLEELPADVGKALRSYNSIFSKNVDRRHFSEEQSNVIELSRLYFVNCCGDYVEFSGKTYPLSKGLPTLRTLFKSSKELNCFIKDNSNRLIPACGDSFAAGAGNMTANYTDKDISKLIQIGLTYAIVGKGLKGNLLIKSYKNLMFLGLTYPSTYFALQVIAIATGQTYRSLMDSVSVNIQDQSQFVQNFGKLFWLSGERVLYLEDDNQSPIGAMSLSSYYKMLQNGGDV